MEYKNEFEIARLISRQRLNMLTPAEEKQLEEWLAASEDNKALYDQLMEGYSFQERTELEAHTDIDKVCQQIAKKMKRSIVHHRVWRVASAAVLLACGVMAAVLWKTDELPATLRLAASTNNIELIFPDGKRVMLDDKLVAEEQLPEGFEFVHETENESKLAYAPNEKTTETPVSFITLNVPKKENYKIELPDGTIVFMNSCSSLRFPERFQTGSREVYLSGEAAFSVKKNKEAPFRVHTDQRTIVVTGTQFNVSAYDDDPYWQTTLVEGAIEVTKGEESIALKPHQQYSLNNESGIGSIRDIPDHEIILAPWSSGTLAFEATTFEEIVRKLQRWYDISWVYENDSIKKKRFTATINKKEPFDVFLTLIEQTTDIKFIIDGNRITVTEKKSR